MNCPPDDHGSGTRGKVCPVVHRGVGAGRDVLAFQHPTAGKQFVKGTIEAQEAPSAAAARELREESGLTLTSTPRYLDGILIGEPLVTWHFYAFEADPGLPQRWAHQTEDDCGHVFSFFWHPLARDLDRDWHPIFHAAWLVIRRSLKRPDEGRALIEGAER